MFKFFSRASFFSKNLLFSTLNVLLIGIILTTASYFIQKHVMLTSLYNQAIGMAAQTKITLDKTDIQSVLSTHDLHSSVQQKLTKQFTDLSSANKTIAQGYILAPKIDNGKQMLIAAPQHVIESGIKPGDMYEPPAAFKDVLQNAIEKKEQGVTEIYTDSLGTWISVVDPIVDEQGSVIALFGMDVDASLIAKGQQELLRWLIPSFLISLLLMISIQFFVLKKVLAPLKDLFFAINTVSEGDLNVELQVRRDDDLGTLSKQFNVMTQKIRQIVEQVQLTTEEIVRSSQNLLAHVEENKSETNQVTKTIQEVASGAESQVQGTEESARTMEEMAVGIQRVAESSSAVSEAALETTKEAEQGNKSVQQTVQQMDIIHTSVAQSVSLVKVLGERSKEVEKIVDVITNIASQTNLLALNAAIEAARAGEHGKGFAVVATEVRKLAEQSTQSAQHIITLIREIQNDTDKTLEAMDSVTNNVGDGVAVVDELGKAFKGILESTHNVSAQIQEISAVSEQMSASSEEVTASVEEMAQIAKESASHSKNVARSSSKQLDAMQEIVMSVESLNKKAAELKEEIQLFKI